MLWVGSCQITGNGLDGGNVTMTALACVLTALAMSDALDAAVPPTLLKMVVKAATSAGVPPGTGGAIIPTNVTATHSVAMAVAMPLAAPDGVPGTVPNWLVRA